MPSFFVHKKNETKYLALSKVKRNKQYVRSSVEPMFIVYEEFCSRFFPLDKTFTCTIGS